MPRKAPPLRTILVPLDGSPFAERALPSALALARRSRARLRVALVHHGAPPPVSSDALELYAEVEKVMLRSERAYLRQVGARLRKALGRPVRSAFLQLARAPQVGLLTLATHGRGGLSRVFLGSVTDKVIRGAELPVLVCRPARASAPRSRRKAAGRRGTFRD